MSSAVAFSGVPVKSVVSSRISNTNLTPTYKEEMEKQLLRKERFIQSRQQAKLIEEQIQEKYRTAMIANVENELFRRRVSILNI